MKSIMTFSVFVANPVRGILRHETYVCAKSAKKALQIAVKLLNIKKVKDLEILVDDITNYGQISAADAEDPFITVSHIRKLDHLAKDNGEGILLNDAPSPHLLKGMVTEKRNPYISTMDVSYDSYKKKPYYIRYKLNTADSWVYVKDNKGNIKYFSSQATANKYARRIEMRSHR